jgi:hypothetical protein
MTNTAADGTVRVAEKEKVEKRRALGRGLESLLPGLRCHRPMWLPLGRRFHRLRFGTIRLPGCRSTGRFRR